MSSTVIALSELAITLIQAYMTAAKQAGLSEEEAKQQFTTSFEKFKVESSVPVDEVVEGGVTNG